MEDQLYCSWCNQPMTIPQIEMSEDHACSHCKTKNDFYGVGSMTHISIIKGELAQSAIAKEPPEFPGINYGGPHGKKQK